MTATPYERVFARVLNSYIERLTPAFQDEAQTFFASLPIDILRALEAEGLGVEPRLSSEGKRADNALRAGLRRGA